MSIHDLQILIPCDDFLLVPLGHSVEISLVLASTRCTLPHLWFHRWRLPNDSRRWARTGHGPPSFLGGGWERRSRHRPRGKFKVPVNWRADEGNVRPAGIVQDLLSSRMRLRIQCGRRYGTEVDSGDCVIRDRILTIKRYYCRGYQRSEDHLIFCFPSVVIHQRVGLSV